MKPRALLALILLISCTNENGSKRALEGLGLTNVRITGYSLFGCSQDDSTCTAFVAERDGKQVRGVVGCGLDGMPFAKGCTVRFE